MLFSAGSEQLFGILTMPAGPPAVDGAAAILLTGGGFIPGSHRNRMWTHLARHLAALGFPALRFDYRGVGESSGVTLEFWLDRPFSDDLAGAVRWLRDRGMTHVVLAGSCFGARTILGTADQIEDLAGVALLSVPLRGHRWGEYAATRFADELTVGGYVRRAASLRVLRRLRDPRWRAAYLRVIKVKTRRLAAGRRDAAARDGLPAALQWVSPKFLEPIRHLAERRVPMLFLYGDQEEYYAEFRRAVAAGLAAVFAQSGVVDVRIVDGVLHGFTTIAMQQATLEHAGAWIAERLMASPARPLLAAP